MSTGREQLKRKDAMTSTSTPITDTLTSIVEELSAWPGGTTVPADGLAERLRPLISRPHLDPQAVAWALDMDGRYGGLALSPELDESTDEEWMEAATRLGAAR